MRRLLAVTGLRLLFCAAVAYVLWRLLGAVGLVVSAPLFGVLLARPLLELVAELRHSARQLAYSELEGRHFEHRGFSLSIVEDERHHRWVRVSDVRKVISTFPREAVLRQQFPEGLRDDAAARGPMIHADALLAYLARSTEPGSVRFRNWLEREVVFPAARIRQRLGIRDAVPSGSKQPPEAP
jgi:hypothetical protein